MDAVPLPKVFFEMLSSGVLRFRIDLLLHMNFILVVFLLNVRSSIVFSNAQPL